MFCLPRRIYSSMQPLIGNRPPRMAHQLRGSGRLTKPEADIETYHGPRCSHFDDPNPSSTVRQPKRPALAAKRRREGRNIDIRDTQIAGIRAGTRRAAGHAEPPRLR